MNTEGPKINPGDIILWPMLKLDYDTKPDNIKALLPPGIEASTRSQVHLTVYHFPVPDVPEFGILMTVDADYKGEEGQYTLGYGIDQESAIFISRDRNGQPKYPCEIEYYRMLDGVHARCSHQGYTFLEFDGKAGDPLEHPDSHTENELLDVLEEAMEARVVEELPGLPGRFEFTHALIQGTLASELSATRTVRMHARIATALELLHGEDAEAHAEELLGHFVQAETVLGADPVVHYAAIAGRHALDSFDPALAAQYYSSGIEALGDGAEDERLANLLWGLGQAQNSTLERAELQTAIDNLTLAARRIRFSGAFR